MSKALRTTALVVLAWLAAGSFGVLAWAHHEGYHAYIVHTGSMTPTYPSGDLVIDRTPTGGYQVGDVITFRHGDGADVVTHRLVQSTPQGLRTKGDANATRDTWYIRPGQVQGVVAGHVPYGGYVVVFFGQPAAVAGLMCAGLALVLLWGLFFPPPDADREPPSPVALTTLPEPISA